MQPRPLSQFYASTRSFVADGIRLEDFVHFISDHIYQRFAEGEPAPLLEPPPSASPTNEYVWIRLYGTVSGAVTAV